MTYSPDAHRQKAPSAIRCIKTSPIVKAFGVSIVNPVRKHLAPNGALRPADRITFVGAQFSGHKAPSAKRGIKT